MMTNRPIYIPPYVHPVLALLCEGLTCEEAAAQLGTPFWTVRARLRRARHKAGCKTLTELCVRYALKTKAV